MNVTTAARLNHVREVRGGAAPATPAVKKHDVSGYFNRALGDIERIRNPFSLANFLPDARVQEATRPRLRDNAEAVSVRKDYRDAYHKTRERQQSAQGTVDLYHGRGAGPHRQLDGSTVTIQHNLDGSTRVTTRRPDGSERTDTLHQDPTRFSSTTRAADGHTETWERHGTSVRHHDGFKHAEYSLNDQGQPRQRVTNRSGGYETQVHEDGSTDTSNWGEGRQPASYHWGPSEKD